MGGYIAYPAILTESGDQLLTESGASLLSDGIEVRTTPAGFCVTAAAPYFNVTLACALREGVIMFKTGLGDHDFEIDVTRAVASLGELEGVTARVMHRKSEYSIEYTAGATVSADKLTDESTHLYTSDVDGDEHTFLTFWHCIERRGEHRIALRFEFGGGKTITTTDAIVLLSGDGMLEDF